jgi:hypothetical protein
MKKSVTIKLSDTLELEVIGNYIPEEMEVRYTKNGDGYPGFPSDFDIEDVKIVKGNIIDLLEELDNHQWKQVQKVRDNPNKFISVDGVWTCIIELAIKEIENE